MPRAPERRLARLRARYEKHAAQLARVGFMLKGSLVQRFLTCGTPSCRCHTDPSRLHGPYWQWSRAVGGKTVSRMLREDQVRRYQEWIENWKRFDKIVAKVHDVSSQADAILLAQERESRDRNNTSRHHPQPRKSAARR
ncbi:MAG: hypothetical protein Q8Q85_04470 [Gemmatimonadales bacterium]|nr:hypothetical protein [Gemmatimonadales bacterium]